MKGVIYMSFFQKKTIAQLTDAADASHFKKNLGALDLTFLGVGGIIGAGIFVLTGIAAAIYAGPAVVISYFLAGFLCILVGLTYSEFASFIPSSGSVYAYSFASLGEGMAFLCGWSLLLAYTVTASSVAVGFSGYFSGIVADYGWVIPDYLLKTPSEGGLINLPAIIIIILLMLLLIRGTKESSRLNFILVLVSLVTIIGFIACAAPSANATNLTPFMPFGFNGVVAGTAVVFFSYMGFDAIATSAEECKNPSKDLPIGIILSIGICMLLYMGVALTMSIVVPYTDLNTPQPAAYILRHLGMNGMANLIGVGIIAGLITTLIVYIYGQSRIFFAISRDGLLPQSICKLHPKYQTPYITTIVGSLIMAIISGFVPLMHIVELSNTGTLAVFLVNFVGIVTMRRNQPNLNRKFKCPALYLISIVGFLICFYLIYALSTLTHILFIGWIILGLLFYKFYGDSHRCWDK